MENFDKAYKSLDNAKREEQELKDKRESFEEIYRIVNQYCNQHGYLKFRNISEQRRALKKDNKDERISILIALLGYTLGFGVIDFIAVFVFGNVDVIVSSIVMGLIYFTAHSSKFVVNILKNNKNLKMLNGLEESLSDDPKYKDQTLQDILSLVGEEKVMLTERIADMGESIKEYEAALSEANKALAEEVLAESGIEASVTLNSSMKILAKRYEEDKS